MDIIRIKRGRDIHLRGAAVGKIEPAALPSRAAIQPTDFRGIRWRLLARPGDPVQVGTPVLEDKAGTDIRIVSPVSGRVAEVNRGEKRALHSIVFELDGKQEGLKFPQYSPEIIPRLSREEVLENLLATGLWPFIRQRPFSRIADPAHAPKSIFIRAINTDPLAPDIAFLLQGHESLFQTGIDILRRLTERPLHLCCHSGASSPALTNCRGVNLHRFAGPHPAGTVGTHIHCIDPVRRGDVVWYIEAQDVLRIAESFLEGRFAAERIVAVTGEGATKRTYKRTVIGAPMASLMDVSSGNGLRLISGSVLSGTDVGRCGFLRFYDAQVTVIPEGGRRELLGWIVPGFGKFSFSRMFASSLTSKDGEEISINTDTHGSTRPIVLSALYDRYVALDIPVFFLLRAIVAGDIEEAERLGLLECDEEDFALCSFACPSKTDFGRIVRQGLDVLEREG